MKFEEVVNALKGKNNGSWFNCDWEVSLPLNAKAKKCGIIATKIVHANVRKGIKYSEQKAVKEKVDNGKVLSHELPWGSWKEGFGGLFIEYKGNNYLRAYFGPNPSKTNYFVDGKEVSYEELKTMDILVPSFFKKSGERPDALTVNVENIRMIKI